MICQHCKKKDALVHFSSGFTASGRSRARKHYCRQCADDYYSRTPGMNSERNLIRLSNFYRSKLYDELESQSPEVLDNSTREACIRNSELMRRFFKKRLVQDNIRLNKDAFDMLCNDFCFSGHFYARADQLKAKTCKQIVGEAEAHGKDASSRDRGPDDGSLPGADD
jgi:hypothetical protein